MSKLQASGVSSQTSEHDTTENNRDNSQFSESPQTSPPLCISGLPLHSIQTVPLDDIVSPTRGPSNLQVLVRNRYINFISFVWTKVML